MASSIHRQMDLSFMASKKKGAALETPRIRTVGPAHPVAKLQGPSLSESYPDLEEEWIRGGPYTPDTVSAGSGINVYWRCPDKHCFWSSPRQRKTSIDHGFESKGCPACRRRQPPPREIKPLAKTSVAKEVCEENKVSILDLSTASNRFIVFCCSDCGHKYSTKVCARFGQNQQSCPSTERNGCYKAKTVNLEDHQGDDGEPNYLAMFLKSGSKNRGYKASKLSSLHRVAWTCLENPKHVWFASFPQTKSWRGCPDLSHYPALFEDFDSNLNNRLKLGLLKAHSDREIIWRCHNNAKHIWSATVWERAIDRNGCPHCAPQVLAVVKNNLAETHKELVKEWSSKNHPLTPLNVTKNDRAKRLWECSACGCEFVLSPRERTERKLGCKACLKKDNCIAITHPGLKESWHPTLNLPLTTSNTSAGSKKVVWWKCVCGESYKTTPYLIVLRGVGCKACRQKTTA